MITNNESNIRTMQKAIAENWSEYTTVLKRYNTGSYRYTVIAKYKANKGMYFEVEKHTKEGQYIDKIVIERYSIYGCDYTAKFNIPDSLLRLITSFISQVQNRK